MKRWLILGILMSAGLGAIGSAEPPKAASRDEVVAPSAIPAGLSPDRLQQIRKKFQPVSNVAAAPLQPNFKPSFQMPFRCHQKWRATTYNGHYPDQDSLDLRRYSGTIYNKDTNISKNEAVFASAGGTVSEVGSDWYGDWVYIDHGMGWQTIYMHIDKLDSMVLVKVVVRGQKIGTIGQFEDLEPHLHYTQMFNGEAKRVSFNGVATAVHAGAEKPDGTYPDELITSLNCPSGCSVKSTPGSPPGGSVTCAKGTGVRVVVECFGPANQIDYVRRGPWVGALAASAAKCNAGHTAVDRSFEFPPP